MRAVSRSSASNGLEELSARNSDAQSTKSNEKFINELITAVDTDKIKAICKKNDIAVSANINQDENISETDSTLAGDAGMTINNNKYALSKTFRILSGETTEIAGEGSDTISMDELAGIIEALQKMLKDPNMQVIGKDIESVTGSFSKIQEYISQLQEKFGGLDGDTALQGTAMNGLNMSLKDLVKETENLSNKLPDIVKKIGSELDSNLQDLAKTITTDELIDSVTSSLRNGKYSNSLKTALTQDAQSDRILSSLKISNQNPDLSQSSSINSVTANLDNNLTNSETDEYEDGELSSDEENYTNKGSFGFLQKNGLSADSSQIDGQSLGLNDFSNMLKSSFATIRNNSTMKSEMSNASQGEKTQTLSDVNIAELPIKLNNLVKTTADGSVSSAKLVMNPSELGTVFVEIQMTGGTAKLKITAESKEVAKALESQISTFIDKMAADGIKTEKVEIGFREQNAGSESFAESNRKGNDAETNKTRRDYLREVSNNADSLDVVSTEEEKVPAGLANLAGKIIEKYI